MLINDLVVEDVIMLTALFFACVIGFSVGYLMGRN